MMLKALLWSDPSTCVSKDAENLERVKWVLRQTRRVVG